MFQCPFTPGGAGDVVKFGAARLSVHVRLWWNINGADYDLCKLQRKHILVPCAPQNMHIKTLADDMPLLAVVEYKAKSQFGSGGSSG
ncbi:hypothetical protein QTP86_004856 [Hemibagrus guttatus]|nr:hypothetical protein QTP86_004856 [Hemibagrus guttatus]